MMAARRVTLNEVPRMFVFDLTSDVGSTCHPIFLIPLVNARFSARSQRNSRIKLDVATAR
jgi:hypothetical protein